MNSSGRRRPALARCCLGMQDDSFWRNTAGMNRINGWRLPAKEGPRLLTLVQGEPVWVADKTQSFNAWVALSASAVSEERAYDDFRSGD